MTTTLDGILNKRIMLEQPAHGFRVAVDTVLLASAVPAKAGDKILELGCGVGGAMLALAWRVPGITIMGLEVQASMAQLCAGNIARNALAAKLEVREADIRRLLTPDLHGQFDHVMMNPPYNDEARHDASPDASRRMANIAETTDLRRWLICATQALKADGLLTFIHRADRIEEILGLLSGIYGATHIKPIIPRVKNQPRRVIFRTVMGGKYKPIFYAPLALHEDGAYTPEADAILRDGAAMSFYEPSTIF